MLAFRVQRTLGGWTVIPYDRDGDRPALGEPVSFSNAWEVLTQAWDAQLLAVADAAHARRERARARARVGEGI